MQAPLKDGVHLQTTIEFELCAETLQACEDALAGGATRIELCRDLDSGGLTAEPDLIRAAVERSGLPVHALIRPAADHFIATPERLRLMAESIAQASALGVAGFVLGLLDDDGTVDVEHTRQLVTLAAPLPVTFHRAFDEAADLHTALEAVIASGCRRLLTSGGQADVLAGAATLAALKRAAAGRIQIVAGGGLRLRNAAEVVRVSGLTCFHGSLRSHEDMADQFPSLRHRIRGMVQILEQAAAAR